MARYFHRSARVIPLQPDDTPPDTSSPPTTYPLHNTYTNNDEHPRHASFASSNAYTEEADVYALAAYSNGPNGAEQALLPDVDGDDGANVDEHPMGVRE